MDNLAKLRARLRNYGYWLLYDSAIAPEGTRCISLESRFSGEAGDVFEPSYTIPMPNVADAESLHAIIKQLDCISQYCLVARVMEMIGQASEANAVFRIKRIGEAAMKKQADNAEYYLYESINNRA